MVDSNHELSIVFCQATTNWLVNTFNFFPMNDIIVILINDHEELVLLAANIDNSISFLY